ncbi:MAG: hypothetical protein IKZ32_02230 [Alistipes sp.]|nr:hypothetical protein [Alistipes sp.]
MKTLKQLTFAIVALCLSFIGVSCDKEPAGATGNTPTIGILEPEFDTNSMTVKVMIAPSTDATAWYYKVEWSEQAADYTKVEGAAAKEIEFEVQYGVEYTISAYAENKSGKSDVVTKKFCQMPTDEVAIAIGEITLNEETMEAKAMIYPSANTTKWYWRAYEKDSIKCEWIGGEGTTEKMISFAYEWGKTYIVEAYAECGAIKSEETSAECYFEPTIPTITVSKPMFDEATMTVSFEVTPSEDTHHWYWGPYGDVYPDSPSAWTYYMDNEPRTVSYAVEYDQKYQFTFRAENAILKGEEKRAEFAVMSPGVEIAIENLTAYSLDAVITKKDHCVKYVAGALHTDAYDRNIFIEQAQSSLNPDENYPFAVFNSATESRTFSEQDLVRNSLVTSDENAGIMLVPGTSYTIAVYSENAEGICSVTTKEFEAPTATLNGNVEVSVEVSNITETSATVNVEAATACKIIVGYMDPAVTKVDTYNPFDFEGKSDEEIRNYLISMTHAIPTLYTEPIVRSIDNLAIGGTYYAYAIAIKDGKIGDVSFKKFATKTPSLTGVAKITSAEIVEQTTHETLTVILTTDNNATKVRLYAAPESDHSAYASNLEYIMDASDYQNYREEYEIVDGVATAVVDIYHPGTNYYLYAVAVDQDGKAGEMVCVAQMAGLETEYYTTIEEVEEEINIDLNGTGTVDMVISITGKSEDRISLTVNTDTRSANAQKVWIIRFNGKITQIEDEVKYAFSEYADTKTVKGSYKEGKVGYPLKYEDGGSDWDPKYEALQEYNATYGGDILVAVVLDTDGKFNIYSYYAAGGSVNLY